MSEGLALSFNSPNTASPEVKTFTRTSPKPTEVEVAVAASSVNPIDVQRASGYGRKLLSLLGASKFPLVLGNDFSGVITAVGDKVSDFNVGDHVFGVKKASRVGTNASHVIVPATPATIRKLPDGFDPLSMAALPYCFTTMWLAVRNAGLSKSNAAGKDVLVHGAAGGLGSLALRMLSDWGANVTAIARPNALQACLDLGASNAIDLATHPFSTLKSSFDATLNFATWDHDADLLGCLRDGALGHATTVHPMLRNFDEAGFVGGAFRTMSGKRRCRKALPDGTQNYSWTIFGPNADALSELERLVSQDKASLEIGLKVPLKDGALAFDHMRTGKPGRALILP